MVFRKLSRMALAGMLLTSAALLSGCGGGGGENNNSAPAGSITISMTEFAFNPSELKLKAGESAQLVVKNEGSVEHDFSTEGVNSGSVQPGQSKTVTVKFDQPGTYEFICTVAGHKDSGMVGKIIVE